MQPYSINFGIFTLFKQTASCEATYGIPWWQYLPKQFSCVFTDIRHKDVLLDKIGRMVDEAIGFEQDEDWSEPKSIIRQLMANKNLDRQVKLESRASETQGRNNRHTEKSTT